MIIKFLNKFQILKKNPKKGKSNFNKRSYPKHNKLNINKSIKKQFNLLEYQIMKNFLVFFYFPKT